MDKYSTNPSRMEIHRGLIMTELQIDTLIAMIPHILGSIGYFTIIMSVIICTYKVATKVVTHG